MLRSERRHATWLLALLAAGMTADLGFGASALAQPSDVQRGEYLARAGDCISCHSSAGGAPYAGGDRLNTPFG